MNYTEQKAVFGIIERIAPVVLSTVPTAASSSAAAAMLRQAVGAMVADSNMAHINTFSVVFSICVDIARLAGATLLTMDRVRKAALDEDPQSLPETQTVLAIIRATLAQEARIISRMTFKSRRDVDDIAAMMNVAFQQAEEVASDDLDAGMYVKILSLHSAVVKHLADIGRVLPRIVNKEFATTLPALSVVQRVYGKADRVKEIVDENYIVHPAFCPMQLRMLAV